MVLRLPDHWLWDFWLARADDHVHLFFLQAPRTLGDPELRHSHARIGHAVSRDLRSWERCPDALGAGSPGSFDDRATWTGSVLPVGGRWLMAYTGICNTDDGTVQRVGFAESSDLTEWARCGPVVEADGRWYEKRGPDIEHETWRDPWLFEHEGRIHMFITARANSGSEDGRGVIAQAWTDDLVTWEVGPPLEAPREFKFYEVPQLAYIGERWRLFFSAQAHEHSRERLARPGVTAEAGTHVLSSTSTFGPFELDGDAFLVGDREMRHYAGRCIEHDDRWWFLAWLALADDGEFDGALSDPLPLSVRPNGRLAVEMAALADP